MLQMEMNKIIKERACTEAEYAESSLHQETIKTLNLDFTCCFGELKGK